MMNTKWVTSTVTATRDVLTDGRAHFTFKAESEFTTPLTTGRRTPAAAPHSSVRSRRPTPAFKEERKSEDLLNSTIPWAETRPRQAKMGPGHHHHVTGVGQLVHPAPHLHAPCFPPPSQLPCPQLPAAASCSQRCCCPVPCHSGHHAPTSTWAGNTGGHGLLFVDDACYAKNCTGSEDDN